MDPWGKGPKWQQPHPKCLKELDYLELQAVAEVQSWVEQPVKESTGREIGGGGGIKPQE